MTVASSQATESTGRGNTSLWPTLALLGVTVAWGATFVVVQMGVEAMPVSDYLFWRFGIAAVVMALLRPRSLVRLSRRDWRNGAILGSFLAAAYFFQTIGLQYTSASVSGFITGMFLVFVPLITAVVLKKPVAPSAWLAVGVATVGLGLLSLNGLAVGIGEFVTLLGAVAFAFHLVALSEWSTGAKAYGLTVVQLGVVAIVAGVGAISDGAIDVPATTDLWINLLFMALVATLLAYFLTTWALAHLPPVRGAVILTMEPVFAGIFGVAIAGDEVTWRTAVGAGMILGATYLVELGPRRGVPEEAPYP